MRPDAFGRDLDQREQAIELLEGCSKLTEIAEVFGVNVSTIERWIRRDRKAQQLRTWEYRFWARIDVAGPGECWEWLAALDNKGYGTVRRNSRNIGSHRAAWELEYGSIPDGLSVCHRCDNPPCCNPGHMFLGTRVDNRMDCVAKGRQTRGIEHPSARLTEDDVRSIRRRWVDGRANKTQLAEEYGIAWHSIDSLIKGKTWRHVT